MYPHGMIPISSIVMTKLRDREGWEGFTQPSWGVGVGGGWDGIWVRFDVLLVAKL